MQDLVTLVILTRNRHVNLDRLLEYYHGASFQIIIADSSHEKHRFRQIPIRCRYIHHPGAAFPARIEAVLNLVDTPYVVMCAEDDFILPGAIHVCTDFLSRQKEFMCAQGYTIYYRKNDMQPDHINLTLPVLAGSFDVTSDDPFSRLERTFRSYRSLLYSVHRTPSLKLAFRNAGFMVKDFFLAEYLAAITPAVLGKCKDLPVLYRVSELPASPSPPPGRTGKVLQPTGDIRQLNALVSLVTFNLSNATGLNKDLLRDKINHAFSIVSGTMECTEPSSNKINSLISHMQVIPGRLNDIKRKREIEMQFREVLKRMKDHPELNKVSLLLRKYASTEGQVVRLYSETKDV